MEKYIVLLTVLAILAFMFCTVPVLNTQASNTYLVCKSDAVADMLLTESEKWATTDYYVYKLAASETEIAKKVPEGRLVKEYLVARGNKVNMRNPFMQATVSGETCVYGLPYVID